MQNPQAFVRAIAQFNAGKFFACHETLEPLWQEATGDERFFLHALIQTAVALHHHQHNNLKGALSVSQRASQKLTALPPQPFGELARPLRNALQTFFICAVHDPDKLLQYPQIQMDDEHQY